MKVLNALTYVVTEQRPASQESTSGDSKRAGKGHANWWEFDALPAYLKLYCVLNRVEDANSAIIPGEGQVRPLSSFLPL